MVTAKDYIERVCKNLPSTKIPQSPPHNEMDFNPPRETKMYTFIDAIIDLNKSTSKAYSDLTGKFPITSYAGIQYLFVAYHYDANTILAFSMKDKQTCNLRAPLLPSTNAIKQGHTPKSKHFR